MIQMICKKMFSSLMFGSTFSCVAVLAIYAGVRIGLRAVLLVVVGYCALLVACTTVSWLLRNVEDE
jgi:hypothetical protein